MKEDLNILIDRALDLLMWLKNVIGEDAFAEQSLSWKALIEKVDLSFSNDLMSKFLSAAESLSAIYKSEWDWRDKYSEIKKNLEWTDNAVLEHWRYIDGQVNLVIQWLETVISIMEESLKPRNTLWGRFSRKPSFDLKNYNNGISFLKKRLWNFKSCEEIFLNKKKLSDFHGYDFRRGRYNW